MFKLRDYQKDCADAVMEDLKTHSKLGVILPCGAGKTEIFTEIVNRWYAEHPNEIILILSHLSLLTTQTLERINLRHPELSVGVLQAQEKPKLTDSIIISTMQTSRNKDKVSSWISNSKVWSLMPKKVGLIICDETHMLKTPSYDKALSYFPDAKIIGCTATPFRSAKLMTDYFDKISYTLSLQELIDMGYLVKPELNQIIMSCEADAYERMAHVVNLYNQKEKGKPAVVYMRTIEEAKELTTVFNDQGTKCRAVTSELSNDTRDEVLRDFKDRKLDVMTTVNVLSMGFDAPCLEAIFMPYKTESPTLYIQRVGRALRLHEGKDSARIYCYGDAPTIKKGFYRKLEKMSLTGGSPDKKVDVYDDLEFLEITDQIGSEVYNWTKSICDVADRVKEMGALDLYDMIRTKKFPQRYLRNIELLEAGMSAGIYDVPKGEKVTDKQTHMLKIHGFNDEQIERFDRFNASAMIGILMKSKETLAAGDETKWVVPNGKHAGKHVKDLPYYYKSYVLKHFPDAYVSKMIKDYQRK